MTSAASLINRVPPSSRSWLWFAVALFLLPACASIPVDQRDDARRQVDEVAQSAVDDLLASAPGFREAFDSAVGYAAGRLSTTKLPFAGGAYGVVRLVDKEANTHTYLNVMRIEFGAGLGISRFRAVVLFHDRAALEAFRQGKWQSGLAAETVAGSSGGSVAGYSGNSYSVHFLAESGATLTATARFVRAEVNHELTNSGLSAISLPNTGFNREGEQLDFAPREWNRRLPFLAQQVIDEGYDLPLPFGIGVTYADVDQDQTLTDLQVGINGRPVRPLDFVSFDNAKSLSETYSLKADAWVFPFMNVFAMLGKVDGLAPVDVLLDGNMILDGLEISCGGIVQNPLCRILEDETILLPIRASFEGTLYGIGTVLAGGWKGWFVTLPFNWTYADMQGSQTDGASFTATPRGGYVFNMGRYGNLAVFAGGNYLDSNLTVDGIARTPGDELVFDYIIEQDNPDKWNAVLGFNWDLSKRVSLSSEYNGFTGSREAYIASFVWRF